MPNHVHGIVVIEGEDAATARSVDGPNTAMNRVTTSRAGALQRLGLSVAHLAHPFPFRVFLLSRFRVQSGRPLGEVLRGENEIALATAADEAVLVGALHIEADLADGRRVRTAVAQQLWTTISADPPYATDLATRTLEALGAGGVVAPGAIVVAQHLTKRAAASEVGVLKAFRARRFGETTLTFFRAEG